MSLPQRNNICEDKRKKETYNFEVRCLRAGASEAYAVWLVSHPWSLFGYQRFGEEAILNTQPPAGAATLKSKTAPDGGAAETRRGFPQPHTFTAGSSPAALNNWSINTSLWLLNWPPSPLHCGNAVFLCFW